MSIVVVPTDGGISLRLVCDECIRPISAAAGGVAVAAWPAPREAFGRVRHAHAGPCRVAVERALGGQGRATRTTSLADHLAVVALNTGLWPSDLDAALDEQFRTAEPGPDPPPGGPPG